MRGTVIDVAAQMYIESCCADGCGVEFGMPVSLHRELNADSKRWFYCPNGHRQHYTQSELDKLRRERDRAVQQQEYQRQMRIEAESREKTANSRAAGYKGHAAKLGKRIKGGACPCCKKRYKALANHMANIHPKYTGEPPEHQA